MENFGAKRTRSLALVGQQIPATGFQATRPGHAQPASLGLFSKLTGGVQDTLASAGP